MVEHDQGQQPDIVESSLLSLSEESRKLRRPIVDALKQRGWFNNTNQELQAELVTLPDNHNGFLADLAERPEEVGGLEVSEMVELPRGAFALIPKFKVIRQEDGTEYTYEYVSWRQGPDSGAKGLVLVEGDEGEYTHFIVLRGDKFATGEKEFDLVGGFAEPGEDGSIALQDRFVKEIQEELGLPDLEVKRAIPLGKVHVDAGMTNNHPSIFGAVIDGSEAERLSDSPVNPDIYELKSGTVVFPMSQLKELIKANDDAFFLTTVVRMVAEGEIELE
jgi:hypothetical protein